MPSARAPSVPGFTGTHSSQRAAVWLNMGSMAMSFVPLSRASMRKCMFWIWLMAGFAPQMRMVLAFIMSAGSLPVE